MYGIYLGGYRAALRDARATVPSSRYQQEVPVTTARNRADLWLPTREALTGDAQGRLPYAGCLPAIHFIVEDRGLRNRNRSERV